MQSKQTWMKFAALAVAMLGLTAKAADATYQWTGAVGPDSDGYYDFTDKANWTRTAGSDFWPKSASGSFTYNSKSYDLSFPATDGEVKIRFSDAVNSKVNWNGPLTITAGGKYRFVGAVESQEFTSLNLEEGSSLTVESCQIKFTNTFNAPATASFKAIGSNVLLTYSQNSDSLFRGALALESESYVEVTGNFYFYQGCDIALSGSSVLYFKKEFGCCVGSSGEPCQIVIDDSKLIGGSNVYICKNRTGGTVTFSGKSPCFLAKSSFNLNASGYVCTFDFDIPSGGYETVPLVIGSTSGSTPNNGQPTLTINADGKVFTSASDMTIPLVATAGAGIKNIGSTGNAVVLSALPADIPDGAEAKWQYSGEKASLESAYPFTPTLPEITWADSKPSATCIVGVYVKGVPGEDEPEDPPIGPVEPGQPSAPQFASFAADGSAGDTIAVSGKLGVGGTVKVEVATSQEFAAIHSTVNVGAVETNGTFEATFHDENKDAADYIQPGSTYYVRAIATSLEAGCELAATSAVKQVTTLAASGVTVTGFSHASGSASVTVTGKVSPKGAGTTKVWILWCTDGKAFDQQVLAATVGPDDAATWSKTIDMGVAGKAFCYKIYVENECATASWATEPTLGTGSETPVSGATIYYWKGKDGSFVGDWADPENWDANDPDHYYPDPAKVASKAITVDFSAIKGHAARINLPATTSAITYDVSSASLVFPESGYNIHFVAPAGNEITFLLPNNILQNDFELGIEGAKKVTLGTSEVYLKGENQTLVFKDTTVDVTASKSVRLGEGTDAGSNHTLVFDNATLNASGAYRGIILNSAYDTIVVKGRSPKLYVGHLASLYNTESEYNCGRIVFEIPVGGFTSTPIDGTGSAMMFNVRQNSSTQGGFFRIEVDRSSPAFDDPSMDWKEQTLVSWPKGFSKPENLLLDAGGWSVARLSGQFKPVAISGTTLGTSVRGKGGLAVLVTGSAESSPAEAQGLWFESGIAAMKAWAAGGEDISASGLGTWSRTGGAIIQIGKAPDGGSMLDVSTGGEGEAVTFTPKTARTVGANGLTVSTKVAFEPSAVLPTDAGGLKAALAVLRTVSGAVTNDVYYGWAKSGAANGWVALSGAMPQVGVPVTVTASFAAEGGKITTVAYAVDGVELTAGGVSALPTVQADAKVGAVGYCGIGRLYSLSAAAKGAPTTVKMSVPASFENMAIASVLANGVEVAPDADGGYVVPAGATLAVKFAANKGYRLLSGTMIFTAEAVDFALPENGRPTPVEGCSNVRINEVMASNAETLARADGTKGIDWIELYNEGDEPVSLKGWCFTDNDDEMKEKKWEKIKGNATIAAHGYLVVFADSDLDGWDAHEAYVELGLSGNGEKLTLITPEKEIASQLVFDQQFEDISVGLDGAGKLAYFHTPTPWAENPAEGVIGLKPAVTFSEPHGYKTAPFALAMTCVDSGATIYYTTDGTQPTTSSSVYSAPITISETTVIRAAAAGVDAILQRDTVATYLFLDDIVNQTTDSQKAKFLGKSYGPGMRAARVAGYDDAMKRRFYDGFTNSAKVCTLSIVVDPDSFFGSKGIYVNATQDGRDWERATMLEQINPLDQTDEFSVPCGIRIRGAFSRQNSPKHGFHLYFRSQYGMSKLNFPLFGKDGPDKFDKIDLKTDQNQAYAVGEGRSVYQTLVHEVFGRDCERDFGKTCNRSRYFNLFINGVYWGVYMYEERCSQGNAAENNGGTDENYDVVRTDHSTRVTKIVEGLPGDVGTSNPYSRFRDILRNEGFVGEHADNYNLVRGLNPDGTRNPDYPIYLNVTNLIGNVFSSHYGADTDSPCNNQGIVNNINAYRNRVPGDAKEEGWIFNRHDCEWTLAFNQINGGTSGGGTYTADNCHLGATSTNGGFNPHEVHWRLADPNTGSAEYRMVFADLVYRHFLRKGGSMTREKCLERFQNRMDEISNAVVAEQVRWAEDKVTIDNWYQGCGKCLTFITNRSDYLVRTIYRKNDRKWYPSIDAPTALDKDGETVTDGAVFAEGEKITLANADQGTVYYTLDGSDPRLSGGTVNSVAATYSAPFAPPAGVSQVRARILKSGEWSALEEVTVRGAGGSDIESDGFLFVLAGDYETAQTITPTGAECRVVLNGAKIPGGLVLDGAAKFTFEPAEGTANEIGSIVGTEATLKLDGKGAVLLEGPDTLATISNLNVKAGTFAVKSTGVTAEKTPVVNVLGYAKQSGGAIDLDLANAGQQTYGIYLANKNPKGTETCYGEFEGGALTATVGGTKSAAIYGNKGSADVTFKTGETVTATLVGSEARLFNVAGKLKLNGGDFTVTSTASDARVFKGDREISVKDGTYRVTATGTGSEIFSTSKNKDGDPSTITISGGTFELVSDDDCFNADDSITVSGGLIYAVSTANDVFDSNGDMTLSGGTILAYALGAGHEAFDVEPMATEDNGIPHVLYVNGGTIFATGGKGALWPATVTTGAGVNVYSATELAAADYSEKYVSLVGGDAENKTTSAVKLPAVAGSTFALFATVPGSDGTAPTILAAAPTKGSRDFHDLYVWSDAPTYQENLRFHTIYGSTLDDGDTGEYIVLTNVSDKTVLLAGVMLTTAKIKKGKQDDPTLDITLGEGAVAAFGSVRLDQADFAEKGWTKITNGEIVFTLTDAAGNPVQTGNADFGLYEQCDGGGAALVAKYFDNDRPLAATTDDWAPSFIPEEPPVDPPEPPPVEPTEIYLAINEVMASNETTLSTPDGAEGLDWVELYNSGDAAVSLEGWLLTDDPDGKASKRKPIVGATEIPAGGYLVVFLDKDKTDWADGVPHAALGLSASGESIALVSPDGTVVSRYDFGAQFKDVSFGPGSGPGGIVYFANPTPGAANGDDGQLGPSPTVNFSERHGYKTAPFDLELSCDDPNAEIYYTFDGTSPTTASAKYAGKIAISQTTVVRARAIVTSGSLTPIHEQDYSATYLFVEDIVRQSADTPEGFLPANTANNGQQKIYYGMVTSKFLNDDGSHVINKLVSKLFKGTAQERQVNLEYDVTQRLYDGFTNDFRTVSLVIDPKALFDGETGIYNHATKQGDEWERQTMIEQIHPGDEADEFSVACGIRIRGAVTRNPGYPKRAFHLSFRSDYGYSKLQHPLFGDEGAKEFDKIDLRNDQTAYPGGSNKETMVHELFSRDCQRDLGTTYNRTRYLNLFINGVYWGLYMYEERVNSDYAESYNKGSAENYDIVRTNMKDENNTRQTCVVEGRTDWVQDFWLDTTLAQGYGSNHPANYNRVRGLNPDGTRNPNYPIYLNVTNLIKYVLVSHYVADTDSPCNSQANVNNIIAFRNRVDGEGKEDGFLWNRHDAEQSLAFGVEVKWDVAESYANIDRADYAQRDNCLFGVFNGSTMLGFKSDNVTVTDKDESHFNPHMLHYRLCDNAEYRTVFADQVYRHLLREGGAMTPTNNYLRYTARMHEIRNAMAGETARWCRTGNDYLTWIKTCASNLAFLEIRTPYMLQIYRNHGWYPSVDAPSATKGGAVLMDGDKVDEGETVTLTGEGGTIWYTLDGSDPRLEGGERNAAAVAYAAPFAIKTVTATVKARTLTANGEWSALEEVTVAGVEPEPTYQENLRFHTIYGSTAEGGDAGEYIVLTNGSENAVTLAGLKVNVEKLDDWTKSGESASKCLFTLVEGTVPAFGSVTFGQAEFWSGAKQKITNGDVYLALTDVDGNAIQSGTAAFGLYAQCDGGGAALVAKRFDNETPLAATTDDWAPSFELPTEIDVEPGRPAEVEAESAEAATNAVVLVVSVPTNGVGEAVVAEATYRGYFLLQATPVAGKEGAFTVAAVLNAAIVKPAIESDEVIETPFTVGDAGGEVTVRALPGLYYSLLRGATLETIVDVRDCKLAENDQVTLGDTEKLPNAAFYRVGVSVSPGKVP